MSVCQALPHRIECEDGDVNPHPLAFEGVCCVDGGAAATEGIKDNIAFVAGGGYQAFIECKRFLCWVPKAFFGSTCKWIYVCHNIVDSTPF